MRGSLDAVMLNIQVFDTLKFYETAKYVSLSVGSPVGYWISINQDTWNGFTPQVREAFMRAANEWGAGLLDLVTSSAEASTKNLKQKGVQFVEFSPKEWEGMIARAGDPWAAAKDYLITDLRVDAGLAERFLKRWRELTDEYDKKYPAGKTWKYE
jgi:TRAP-type C4-dicarboxylate transport system substrate-binding protein